MAGFELTSEASAGSRRAVQECVLFLLVLALCLLSAFPAYAAPSGFTYCGPDGDACDLRGVEAFVTFGAGEGSCDTAGAT